MEPDKREDLSQRSLNVIDNHLAIEEKELSSDLETIEERILTLQQLLHSVKYHASLNLYAYDRVYRKSDENCNRKNSLNHPTIQRYFGKSGASVSSFPNAEKISRKPQKLDNDDNAQNNADKCGTTNSSNTLKETEISVEINETNNKQVMPEQEPIIIGQRRREPFQKKVRIYLGNTYRYIKDSEGVNPMKFQWRITLRTQDKEDPIENFISYVKYTLHESYAPNNVIVKKSPFTLTHKGWGEFQVNVELHFLDGRNKPIKMIHTLKLARKDDSLSYSGLWRMGHENLYEIWIFDKAKDLEIESIKKEVDEDHKDKISEDCMKANLHSLGICSEISYKDNQGNLTYFHTRKRSESSNEDYSTECVKKEVNVDMPTFFHTPKRSESPNEDYSTECVKKEVDVDMPTFFHTPKRSESPNEDYSTECVKKEVDVDMPNDCTNLISKNVTGIGIPLGKKVAISYLDNFCNKYSNFVSLYESSLPKSSYESIKEERPDLISPIFKNIKLPSPLSESSQDVTSENTKTHCNNNHTLVVDTNTKSDSVPSCSKESINIKESGSSISNINTIKRILFKKVINIKPSLQSKKFRKNFSVPLPGGTLRVRSVDLPSAKSKYLTAGSSTVNLKTVSLSKVKNLNKICSKSNYKSTYSASVKNKKNSVNPDLLKTDLLAFSTNENHRMDKKSSDTNNSSLNNYFSNELAVKKLISPSNSSLPSTPLPHDQITLTYNKKDNEHTKKQLIASLPKGFKIYNITKKKFISSTPLDKVNFENQNSNIDSESNYINNLENRKLEIRGFCVKCSSVEEVIRIYWKNLRGFLTLAKNFAPSTADSQTYFTRYCERSVEFWLAREIRKELKILNLKDRERWSTSEIVSWARKHLFMYQKTDISYLFELEKKFSSENNIDITSTLNIASPSSDDYRNNKDADLSQNIKLNGSFYDSINVVDGDEKKNSQKVDESPEDREILMFTPDYMVEPIQFIDYVLSRTRNRFRPEEIIEGVNMDIAKYILYKATLGLMEDLLRCSFSVAAAEVYHKRSSEERSENKPITINEKHITTVLSKHRLSFQTLTQYGLAKRFVGPFSTTDQTLTQDGLGKSVI
ncbi:YEATS domain-containing protein 2 [Armadillidium vulgare]|nr:YEATS domain-containing protein 2 [Armadillidium vulgare]